MSPEELKTKYAALSTKELLEIIDNKFDYSDLAVSIAFQELSSRKISEEDIKGHKEDLVDEAVGYIQRNISDDLTILQKHLFYFIWIPLINFPFKQNFRDDGYVLKLLQANYYSLIGFIVFMLSGFVGAMYDFSTLSSLIFWIIGFVPAYALDETYNRKYQIRKLLRRNRNPEEEEEKSTIE